MTDANYDLADHDLFECTTCHTTLDIEDSIKVSDELICPRCAAIASEVTP